MDDLNFKKELLDAVKNEPVIKTLFTKNGGPANIRLMTDNYPWLALHKEGDDQTKHCFITIGTLP